MPPTLGSFYIVGAHSIQLRKRTFRHRAFILDVFLAMGSTSKTCKCRDPGSLILDPGSPKHDAGLILVLVVLVLCRSFPANRQAGAGGDYRVFLFDRFYQCP